MINTVIMVHSRVVTLVRNRQRVLNALDALEGVAVSQDDIMKRWCIMDIIRDCQRTLGALDGWGIMCKEIGHMTMHTSAHYTTTLALQLHLVGLAIHNSLAKPVVLDLVELAVPRKERAVVKGYVRGCGRVASPVCGSILRTCLRLACTCLRSACHLVCSCRESTVSKLCDRDVVFLAAKEVAERKEGQMVKGECRRVMVERRNTHAASASFTACKAQQAVVGALCPQALQTH
jgi:hypothetical protein